MSNEAVEPDAFRGWILDGPRWRVACGAPTEGECRARLDAAPKRRLFYECVVLPKGRHP